MEAGLEADKWVGLRVGVRDGTVCGQHDVSVRACFPSALEAGVSLMGFQMPVTLLFLAP